MNTDPLAHVHARDEKADPDILTIRSKIVYANRWMTVREDDIRRRDGSLGLYGYVEKPDFVMVLPFDGTHLHLVQQYRYPIGARQWEFPQGSWEEDADVDPLSLARGELREETGLVADSLEFIGVINPLHGTVTQKCHVFFATGLTVGIASLELEEQDLVAERFSVDDVKKMILAGDIQDAGTIAAFGLSILKNLIGPINNIG